MKRYTVYLVVEVEHDFSKWPNMHLPQPQIEDRVREAVRMSPILNYSHTDGADNTDFGSVLAVAVLHE